MMRLGRVYAGIAVLALVLAAGTARAGWWDEAAEAKDVDLADVVTRPHEWKGREITFTCTFHQVMKFYNPYYTRFVPEAYIDFAAWPAGAEIWKEEAYVASHPFLFVERGSDNAKVILSLPQFSRLKLTGVVQDTFKNTPWIEVRTLEVLEESLTRNTLALIIRGDRAAEQGDAQTALARYMEAATESLPTELKRSLARKQAEMLARLGRKPEARQCLAALLAEKPEDEETRKLFESIDGTSPAAPVVAPTASPPTAPATPPPAAHEAVSPPEPVPTPPPGEATATAPPREAATGEGPDVKAPAEPPPATPAEKPGPKKRLSGPM